MNRISVSSLRALNSDELRTMREPIVVVNHSTPIAAVVPYSLYLEIQDKVEAWKRACAEARGETR